MTIRSRAGFVRALDNYERVLTVLDRLIVYALLTWRAFVIF
jgi:hypothetical protein